VLDLKASKLTMFRFNSCIFISICWSIL